jgi:DNA-binding CsgD family transcriptional regulator
LSRTVAEEFERAQRLLDRIRQAAWLPGSPGARVFVLWDQSEVDFRTGRWAVAYAHALEALGMARETGQALWILPFLTRIEAGQGRERESRAHAEEALELARQLGGLDTVTLFAESALGLLELGVGRSDAALEHMDRVARLAEANGLGEAGITSWAPDRIEALARAGRSDDAEAALAWFQREAERSPLSRALAAASRCAGLLAAQFDASFAEALRLHDRTLDPFERARTELAFGERLRRAKRKTEAREQLHAALETFERLGAAPWADQAYAELQASGLTLRRRREAVGLDELTPQELQVALVVARGATNREVAARLFLSPRTVENHLHRVFMKLDVRSRTELAHLLASGGALERWESHPPREATSRAAVGTPERR